MLRPVIARNLTTARENGQATQNKVAATQFIHWGISSSGRALA